MSDTLRYDLLFFYLDLIILKNKLYHTNQYAYFQLISFHYLDDLSILKTYIYCGLYIGIKTMIGMGIELRYMIFYAKPSPVTNPLVYSIDVLNHTSNFL